MLNRMNKKGVTLIEVLVALVVLLIVFMGLLQTSLLSIESNAITILRDEAVRLASDTMTALRTSPFDDLNRDTAADAPNFKISSTGNATERANATNLGINTVKTMRNILNANYVVTVTIDNVELDADNKRVTVLVRWDWKDRTFTGGNPYSHTIVALLRRT